MSNTGYFDNLGQYAAPVRARAQEVWQTATSGATQLGRDYIATPALNAGRAWVVDPALSAGSQAASNAAEHVATAANNALFKQAPPELEVTVSRLKELENELNKDESEILTTDLKMGIINVREAKRNSETLLGRPLTEREKTHIDTFLESLQTFIDQKNEALSQDTSNATVAATATIDDDDSDSDIYEDASDRLIIDLKMLRDQLVLASSSFNTTCIEKRGLILNLERAAVHNLNNVVAGVRKQAEESTATILADAQTRVNGLIQNTETKVNNAIGNVERMPANALNNLMGTAPQTALLTPNDIQNGSGVAPIPVLHNADDALETPSTIGKAFEVALGLVSNMMGTSGTNPNAKSPMVQYISGFLKNMLLTAAETLGNTEQIQPTVEKTISSLNNAKTLGQLFKVISEFTSDANKIPVSLYGYSIAGTGEGEDLPPIGEATRIILEGENAILEARHQESTEAAPLTEEEMQARIKEQKDEFVNNSTRFLTIKTFHKIFLKLDTSDYDQIFQTLGDIKENNQNASPDDLARMQNDKLKEIILRKVDERHTGSFNPIRWIAKSCYDWIFNFIHKINDGFGDSLLVELQSSINNVSDSDYSNTADGLLDDASGFLQDVERILYNLPNYGETFTDGKETIYLTGRVEDQLLELLKSKAYNQGLSEERLYKNVVKKAIARYRNDSVPWWIPNWAISKVLNHNEVLSNIINMGTGSIVDEAGYTHALNSVLKDQLIHVRNELKRSNGRDGDGLSIEGLSDGRKEKITQMVKLLFEVLDLKKCKTRQEILEVTKDKSLLVKLREGVDAVTTEDLITTALSLIVYSYRSFMKRDRLQTQAHQVLTLLNSSCFYPSKKPTAEEKEAVEATIESTVNEILELSVDKAVKQSLDFHDVAKQRKREHFIEKTKELITIYNDASAPLYVSINNELDPYERIKLLNQLADVASRFTKSMTELENQFNGDLKMNKRSKLEAGKIHTDIANAFLPIQKEIAALYKITHEQQKRNRDTTTYESVKEHVTHTLYKNSIVEGRLPDALPRLRDDDIDAMQHAAQHILLGRGYAEAGTELRDLTNMLEEKHALDNLNADTFKGWINTWTQNKQELTALEAQLQHLNQQLVPNNTIQTDYDRQLISLASRKVALIDSNSQVELFVKSTIERRKISEANKTAITTIVTRLFDPNNQEDITEAKDNFIATLNLMAQAQTALSKEKLDSTLAMLQAKILESKELSHEEADIQVETPTTQTRFASCLNNIGAHTETFSSWSTKELSMTQPINITAGIRPLEEAATQMVFKRTRERMSGVMQLIKDPIIYKEGAVKRLVLHPFLKNG